MTNQAKALVINEPGGETTLVHFGIIIPNQHETEIMIQQCSQCVLINKHQWNEMKNQIDQFFNGIKQ